MSSEFFCNLPFTAIHSGDGIHAGPCCEFKPKSRITIDNYVVNDEIRQVKDQMLNGQAPTQCSVCYKNESNGIFSFRQQSKFHIERDRLILEKKDPDFFSLKDASLVTGNHCNLKCHPCINSSYIRSKELYTLGFLSQPPKKIKNPSFDFIFDYDLENLTLTGGEPFLDVVVSELIDRLIETGKSKNIRIDINTNMTAITDERLDLLANNFKQVQIKASIDGIGQVNDYLRYPSEWEVIQNNIEKIKKNSKIDLIVTTALSNMSLLRYHEVIRWAAKDRLDLFISAVSYPELLQPTLLPKTLKNNLLSSYQQIKEEIYDNMTDRTKECIDSCIRICQTDVVPTLQEFKKTIDFFKMHDAVRPGQKLEHVFPELEFYLFD